MGCNIRPVLQRFRFSLRAMMRESVFFDIFNIARCFFEMGAIPAALSRRCLVVVMSLSRRCLVVVMSLPRRCLVVVSSLSCRCLVLVSSLSRRCLVVVSSLSTYKMLVLSNKERPPSSQSQHQDYGGLPTIELSVCEASVVRRRVVSDPGKQLLLQLDCRKLSRLNESSSV